MKLLKFILPVIFIFLSCSRDSDDTIQNTRLELTVLDENNIALPNAEVILYPSQNDFDNDTNMVQTLTTDSNGKVTFENLQAITYYWKIISDCKINNDIANSTNPITANILNAFPIHLADNSVGSFVIMDNNTTVDYNVSYTGAETGGFTTNGTTIFELSGRPVGDYTFVFTPTSGSTPPVSNSITLTCGEIMTLTIE